MKQFLEGADAIARTVALCRPGVISAYPITPQTHIVENLADLIAQRKLQCQFVNVESEHSAASCVLGASAAGVRAYTSTSSQGLLLMAEVLFNIAGMRLPVVLCCVNRSVSAPINIWNDQQDIMAVRDAGMVQLFAESVQESCDLHLQAFKIGEDPDIMLPVVVNIDGFTLSHGFEAVEFPEQSAVDVFLPAYRAPYKLDVNNPMTLGPLCGPEYYLEQRYAIQETLNREVMAKVQKVADEFTAAFGRKAFGLLEEYRMEDAETVLLSFGSLCGTLKEAADALRAKGRKVGVVRLVTYRPFPKEALVRALAKAKDVLVFEKCISLGADGPVYTEVTSALYGAGAKVAVNGYVCGLGGRDVALDEILAAVDARERVSAKFMNVKQENLGSFI